MDDQQRFFEGKSGERHAVQTYEVDMAALIDGDDGEPLSDFGILGEALGEVLGFAFETKTGRASGDTAASFRKFVCLVQLVRPDLLDGQSLSSLGADLGVTRAYLSKVMLRLSDRLGGIRNRAMRPESTREGSRQAALATHARKKAAKAGGTGNAGNAQTNSMAANVE